MGALIFDGLCDGVFLYNQGQISHSIVDATAFGILQAGRIRTRRQNISHVLDVGVLYLIFRRQ